MNIKPFARRLRSAEGSEIAEAALVLPLLFMFLLGIVWFGRAFNIYSTIAQAAQQGAITAARSSCVSCGNDLPTDAVVTDAVTRVMKASNLDPDQIALSNPGLLACPLPPPATSGAGCTSTIDNITVCRNVQLNPTGNNTQTPQCGVVVSFQYPFAFYLPFTSLNLQQVILSAQAQSRMEN